MTVNHSFERATWVRLPLWQPVYTQTHGSRQKNIVLEYDEPQHYVDIEHNILTEKDLERQ